MEVERTDAEPWAPPPAHLRVVVPSGAPFDLAVTLTADGGLFADGTATADVVVLAGGTTSPRLSLSPCAGFARVSLSPPAFPSRLCLGEPCCGVEFALGEPLSSLAAPGEAEGDLTWRASSSDPSVATVRIVAGVLLIEPAPYAEGVVRVEATATDSSGQTATVTIDVPVDYYQPGSSVRGWRRALPKRE